MLSSVKKYVRCLTCHIQEITEYLKALDLLQIVYTENIPISNKKEERIIFTQSGMRFSGPGTCIFSNAR